MKGSWRLLVPAVLAALIVIDSTSLALVVIATTTVAIAALTALTVLLRWPTWVQQFSDWRSDTFSEPEACNQCHSWCLTERLFRACAPSDSKLQPHSFLPSNAAYEAVESLACKRFEAHLLAVAGTDSYLPRWLRRPPVANRIDGTAALDYQYLKQLRPLGSDRS
jgi:hypothetical protein